MINYKICYISETTSGKTFYLWIQKFTRLRNFFGMSPKNIVLCRDKVTGEWMYYKDRKPVFFKECADNKFYNFIERVYILHINKQIPQYFIINNFEFLDKYYISNED